MVELSNEQLSIDRRRIERRLDSLALVNREVETKLERLYTALESGKLDIDDLAPRLKQLRTEQREIKQKQDEALDELSKASDRSFSLEATQEYVSELRCLLKSTSFLESKTFLGSFVRRVEFNGTEVGIEYTVPIRPDKVFTGSNEVPNTGSTGSAGRIRTCDQSVNSRPLYH